MYPIMRIERWVYADVENILILYCDDDEVIILHQSGNVDTIHKHKANRFFLEMKEFGNISSTRIL